MEFLKKNWGKILIATISFVGAIMMIIPLFMAPEFNFVAACQILGIVLFFLGFGAAYVLGMFDNLKLARAIVLIVTGVLVITTLSIGLAGFTDAKGAEKDKAQGALGTTYTQYNYQAEMVSEGNKAFKKALKATPALKSMTLAQVSSNPDMMSMSMLASMADAKQTDTLAQVSKKIDKLEAKLETAKLTTLFTYISLILAMGGFTLVSGSKKLVCNLCKCKKSEAVAAA